MSEAIELAESNASIADPIHIPILYQDEHIVVVDKPPAMLVHRSLIDKRETVFLLQTLRNQLGQYVYPVHRLDRPTSGLMVFGLSSDVARILTEQFTSRKVKKHYVALVRGYVTNAQIIDYPLKEELDACSDKMARQDKAPQDAITEVKPLATAELPYPVGRYETVRYSLVQLSPQTGRKHQLRRHMAHIFHPILGDTTHGDCKQNKFFREHFAMRRLMLMAQKLQFDHPVSKEPMQFVLDWDEFWAQVLQELDVNCESLMVNESA